MVYKKPKFDLNESPATFSCNDEFSKSDQFGDTALRLECFGHGAIRRASSRQQVTKSAPNNDGSKLVLGFGPTPSVSERDLVLRLGLSSASKSSSVEVSNGFGYHQVVDEGSTSSKRSGGYMPSLLLAPRISVPLHKHITSKSEPTGLRISHGGGRQCGFRSCKTDAKGSSMFCRVHGIAPRLSHGLVSGPGPGSPNHPSLSGSSGISNSTGWLRKPAKRRQLIPPQVLVPSSMKSSSILQSGSAVDNSDGQKSLGLVPEGRVHGGSLLSFVSGNSRDAVIDLI